MQTHTQRTHTDRVRERKFEGKVLNSITIYLLKLV